VAGLSGRIELLARVYFISSRRRSSECERSVDGDISLAQLQQLQRQQQRNSTSSRRLLAVAALWPADQRQF